MSEHIPESREGDPIDIFITQLKAMIAEEAKKKSGGDEYDPHAAEIDPQVIRTFERDWREAHGTTLFEDIWRSWKDGSLTVEQYYGFLGKIREGIITQDIFPVIRALQGYLGNKTNELLVKKQLKERDKKQ